MSNIPARPARLLINHEVLPALGYPTLAAPVRVSVLWMLWLTAMAVALFCDPAVSRLLDIYDVPRWLARHGSWPLRMVRAPGEFLTYVPVLAILCFVPRWRWRGALLLGSACAYAGIAVAVLKWTVGRYRPFCDGVANPNPYHCTVFAGGLRGLIEPPPNLCFPSGHTALAFAAATSLGMVFPQYRWWFWIIAGLTGLSRIAQGAHYSSDVVAAAAVGIIAAVLSRNAVALLCNRLRQRAAGKPATSPA
jgi:membrane-associated phospholipid phosphatase